MIKQLRHSRGLALHVVAAHLKISESFLSQIENKKRKPSAELIETAAKYFQCDSIELSISFGIIPERMIEKMMDYPARVMKALQDDFRKYGR